MTDTMADVYGRLWKNNPNERDYPEHWTEENGTYNNTCIVCDNTFIGLKGMRICKACSEKGEKGA